MAQDDYYYEIQLTNKQLVFYFMAGATGLILSFLAGVMVGRGVDAAGVEMQPSRTEAAVAVPETEEPALPTPPPAEELTYAKRLESDKVNDALERPSVRSPQSSVREDKPAPSQPKPAAPKPASPQPAASKPASAATLTIQVAALKDKGSAAELVSSLKAKGFAAYVVSPEGTAGGLFAVRVGSYGARVDAERVKARLEQQKFRPYIVSQ